MTNHRAHANDPLPEHGADPALTPHPEDFPLTAEPTTSVPAVREGGTLPAPVEEEQHVVPPQQQVPTGNTKTVAGGTWVALIIGALLLIALLVFILQNQNPVEVNIITWSFEFPAGIAYLLCAVIGALIMAMVGGVRMFEYRRKIKKMKKAFA